MMAAVMFQGSPVLKEGGSLSLHSIILDPSMFTGLGLGDKCEIVQVYV